MDVVYTPLTVIIVIILVLWLFTVVHNGDLIVKNRLRMISRELKDRVNSKRTQKKGSKTRE